MAAELKPLPAGVVATIKQTALASLTPGRAATTHLSISTQIFPAGYTFKLVDTQMAVREQAALVFVDRLPRANWGHACTYQFYDTTSGKLLYEEDALFPPNLSGGTPLDVFHAPLSPLKIPMAEIASKPILPPTRFNAPFIAQVSEQRYAILWTSQISDLRHVEDLEFLWRALVNIYGFNPSNIYVLCYNGTIGAVDVSGSVGNWAGNNTPYQMKVHASATTANLQSVFNTLATQLKPKDLLLIHTNNHGSTTGLCVDDSTVITPTQFSAMLSGLPAYRSLVVTMEQCFSGAFQSSVLSKSTATNTVFASAVSADKSSDGAAHFDPWAEAWIEAITGATPAGGALSSKPTPNFDGLISMKAACDWAKAHDTGSDDNPQYADQPHGVGSNIFLGVVPAMPARTGDVNSDGCAEIIVSSPWGLGILEQVGNTMSGLVAAANGTRFGGWLLNTADNFIGPLADYDGDGKAEIVITSPWGLGILQLSGSTLTPLMMAPNGTRFGGWALDTSNNCFGPGADYDGDGKAELFVSSPWGIGILKLSGGTLAAPMMAANGTRFGGWLLETTDNRFGDAADYDGDGHAEQLISSPWGLGILKLSGSALTALMMQPNGTRFGGWLLDTSNNNVGRSADYDGDGKAEIFISSPWGVGILKLAGSSLSAPMMASNGTRFGGWLVETPDNRFGAAADYDGDGKAELLVSSAWGIGLLQLSGSTLAAPMMAANGTRFGGWLLNTADNHFGAAASFEGDGRPELFIWSPWGIGILRQSGSALTAPMMQPNGTRFGAWLLNTADNVFAQVASAS
ncbi:MAG: FG-GAP-like repeat-containing protein [Terriglobia bacterium]